MKKEKHTLKIEVTKNGGTRQTSTELTVIQDNFFTVDEDDLIFNENEKKAIKIVDADKYQDVEIIGLPSGLKFNKKTGEIKNYNLTRFHESFNNFLDKDLKHLAVSMFLSPPIFLLYLFLSALNTINIDNYIVPLVSAILAISLPFLIVGLTLFLYIKYRTGYFGTSSLLTSLIIISSLIAISIPEGDPGYWRLFFMIISSLAMGVIISKVTTFIIKSLKDWIFVENEDDNLKKVEYKLSFINKIIMGFLAIIATVLGILLTFQQLIS